jgi:uncharacterized protein
MEMERRYVAGAVEVRADERGKKMHGYAAKFNSRSVDLGGFVEVLAPGVFDRALKENHDVRALVDHNPTLILGRTASGTLRLSVDGTGLVVENDLPDTQAARDLAVSMERGDVTGMSFGFRIMPEGEQWQRTADGMLLRTVTDLELFDVSAVTYPAYPSTEVSARCLEMARRAAEQPKAPLNRLARQIRWYRSQENA